MKYNAIIRRSINPSDFYNGTRLLFSVHKKSWFKSIWVVLDENKVEVFRFSICSFLWYFRINILKQSLSRVITIKDVKKNSSIIVSNDILTIKSKFKIFGKFEAYFFLNDRLAGQAFETASLLQGIKYELEFIEDDEYCYYFTLLFAMYSVGFANVATVT